MEISNPTRNVSASLRVFFSIRMQVAPHPDNREAYSARKAAILRKKDTSTALSQILEVIVLVNVSRQIEDVFVLAYFENMSGFVVAVTGFVIVPLDSPEQKCAQQHSGYSAPNNHRMVHNLLHFKFRSKIRTADKKQELSSRGFSYSRNRQNGYSAIYAVARQHATCVITPRV